jgi:hypothetical protein
VWQCGNNGACRAMLDLSWPSQARRGTAGSGAISSTASTALSVDARGISGGSGSLGIAALPPCVPEDAAGGDPRSMWQLLTGHENGQILVWDAAADSLQPRCKLGEAGSPIRSLVHLEAWGLLCTAHANGEIALFARSAQPGDWGGGFLSNAVSHTFVSGGGGGSTNSSGSGVAAASSSALAAPQHGMSMGTPCVRPRRLALRAHRSNITAAGGCSLGLVTASEKGTLRLWRAADLAREADKAGLIMASLVGRRTTGSVGSVLSGER